MGTVCMLTIPVLIVCFIIVSLGEPRFRVQYDYRQNVSGSKDNYITRKGSDFKPDPDKLLISGREVQIREVPYVAQLAYHGTHFCMGTIINKFTVVTAAHCMSMFYLDIPVKPKIEEIEVLVGSATSNEGTIYMGCRAVFHGKYREHKYPYDVSLLFISGDFKFNAYVKPIEVASGYDWRSETADLVITGFGLSETGELNTHLKATHMSYVESAHCNRSQALEDAEVPADSMFCMYSQHQSSDCKGDSGSGVTWRGKLVGLIVAGLYNECGSSMTPSVYTNLVFFKKWMFKLIKNFQDGNRKCMSKKEDKKLKIEKHQCALSG